MTTVRRKVCNRGWRPHIEGGLRQGALGRSRRGRGRSWADGRARRRGCSDGLACQAGDRHHQRGRIVVVVFDDLVVVVVVHSAALLVVVVVVVIVVVVVHDHLQGSKLSRVLWWATDCHCYLAPPQALTAIPLCPLLIPGYASCGTL